ARTSPIPSLRTSPPEPMPDKIASYNELNSLCKSGDERPDRCEPRTAASQSARIPSLSDVIDPIRAPFVDATTLTPSAERIDRPLLADQDEFAQECGTQQKRTASSRQHRSRGPPLSYGSRGSGADARRGYSQSGNQDHSRSSLRAIASADETPNPTVLTLDGEDDRLRCAGGRVVGN